MKNHVSFSSMLAVTFGSLGLNFNGHGASRSKVEINPSTASRRKKKACQEGNVRGKLKEKSTAIGCSL